MRRFVTLVLALAIANYGILATASAHAHAHDGWHPIHAVTDDQPADAHDHDRSSLVEKSVSGDFDENERAPTHTETGFHSHSTPQFGPADGIEYIAIAVIKGPQNPLDPDDIIHLNRDRPPFKPPRIFL